MRIFRDTTVLGTSSLLALVMGTDAGEAGPPPGHRPATVADKAPVGRWRSADGAVRLEIKTDGTYAERSPGANGLLMARTGWMEPR